MDTILNLVRLGGQQWALNGTQVIKAREMGIIKRIPNIRESEIMEKSNSDSLVKFTSFMYAGWDVAQLFSRWVKGLPSSQLEVVTVAFSFIALCTSSISNSYS